MPSMLLATIVAIVVYNHEGNDQQVTFSLWSVAFFFSLLLIYGVGIVDDVVGLGARTKFSIQVIAAAVLPLSGLYINNLYGFMGIHEISAGVGSVLTVFIIVFICNAVNLIDGIDGLSAGVSFVALTGFMICFLNEGIIVYSILIAGLIGILVPFLYYNIFGSQEKNRKIFMGDSGSLTLGFILGFLFVKYVMVTDDVSYYHPDAMTTAFTLVIVPMFDLVRVALARLRHHTHLFRADKNHIHHKLMRAGLTQHQALCTILALAVLFIVLNTVVFRHVGVTWIVVIDVVLWTTLNFLLNKSLQQKGQPAFQVMS